MADIEQEEGVRVQVIYHDVVLAEEATLVHEGSGSEGVIRLADPLPVGTHVTIQAVDEEGQSSGEPIPAEVLQVREAVGREPVPWMKVSYLGSVDVSGGGQATAASEADAPTESADEASTAVTGDKKKKRKRRKKKG